MKQSHLFESSKFQIYANDGQGRRTFVWRMLPFISHKRSNKRRGIALPSLRVERFPCNNILVCFRWEEGMARAWPTLCLPQLTSLSGHPSTDPDTTHVFIPSWTLNSTRTVTMPRALPLCSGSKKITVHREVTQIRCVGKGKGLKLCSTNVLSNTSGVNYIQSTLFHIRQRCGPNKRLRPHQ